MREQRAGALMGVMRVGSVLVVSVVLSACGEAVAPLVPTTLSISPDGELTLFQQETQLYTAVVHDQNGGVVAIGVTWTIAPLGVASVSLDGLVTALEPGAAVITAAVGSARDFVALTVVAPFDVAIDATRDSYGLNSASGLFECRLTVRAVASGGLPGSLAAWEDGNVQFRFLDGTVSTLALTQLDMVDLWGSSVIHSGDVQQSSRLAEANADFDLTFTARYSVESELRSSAVFIDCAP